MWLNVTILLVLLFLSIILDFLERSYRITPQKSKKILIYVAFTLLVLQSGLRNVAVGPDTYAYFLRFTEDLSNSWYSVIENFKSVYIDNEGKDAGYYLIQKLFSTIFPSFQLFLIFIALCFFGSLFVLIDRYTSTKLDVLLAVLVYLSLFYSFFSVTGCRQTIATSLCLYSVRYINERRLMIFLCLMVIAASIHRSALIFIPFYFVAASSKSSYMFLIAMLIMPLLISISNSYTSYLAVLSGSDSYLAYADEGAAGSKSFLSFYVILTICLFLYQKRILSVSRDRLCILNGIYFALYFLPLTYSSAALMRVVQYFSLFIMIGVPFFVNTGKKRSSLNVRSIVVCLIVVALLYKLVFSGEEYCFFWQDMKLPDNY